MEDGIEYLNEVRLRGRVAAAPEERVLPSGDPLVTLRLVVARPERAGPRSRAKDDGSAARAMVDTLDIACWTAVTRRSAGRLTAGEVVEVEGALRRRFFRAGAGSVSRYEVEARSLRKARAPAASGG